MARSALYLCSTVPMFAYEIDSYDELLLLFHKNEVIQ